jgi:hypothetical protein
MNELDLKLDVTTALLASFVGRNAGARAKDT